jgi:predicted RNase H-like HicB family nuclease
MYSFIFRKSDKYWVALCLENGLVGQGASKDEAASKLKEAIESFEEVLAEDENVYSGPIPIRELHEFLTIENTDTEATSTFELRAVHA